MITATKKMFSNYLKVEGRTSRRDFWLAYIMSIILFFVLIFVLGVISSFVTGVTSNGTESTINPVSPLILIIESICIILFCIPIITMLVRRMHDINKSGWWILTAFIPLVGSIILFILLILPSVDENNVYGDGDTLSSVEPAPTIEPAPTVESAPTIEPASTVEDNTSQSNNI